jgi:diacylglycerol kinase family enzyme
MRAVLIVNPAATGTTASRRDLLTHALAGQLELRVATTRARGHAADLAAAAGDADVELVVVHAGDGTVNEVVNGLLSRGPGPGVPKLAIVPGGSTNVFARAIGIDPDPTLATEQILAALEAGSGRRVSLGRVGERYFTFNSGIGLDAQVVRSVERERADGRGISNALHLRAAVREVLRSDRTRPRLQVELADRPAVSAHLLFASNVSPWTYYGSRPIRTNPGTTTDTGLGVFALTSMRMPQIARVAAQLVRSGPGPRGGAVLRGDDEPWVRVTADQPVAVQADGDYLGTWSEVLFSSVPSAIDVVLPELPGPPAECSRAHCADPEQPDPG